MATYKIDSSLLTAQADEIRTLNGTTATMNPSEMTTALQSANAEVAAQEQKIIEITEMLQGKAMGGSGGSAAPETCTVNAVCDSAIYMYAYTAVENGAITVKADYFTDVSNPVTSLSFSDVMCGSAMVFRTAITSIDDSELTNATQVFWYSSNYVFSIDAPAGGVASINMHAD